MRTLILALLMLFAFGPSSAMAQEQGDLLSRMAYPTTPSEAGIEVKPTAPITFGKVVITSTFEREFPEPDSHYMPKDALETSDVFKLKFRLQINHRLYLDGSSGVKFEKHPGDGVYFKSPKSEAFLTLHLLR